MSNKKMLQAIIDGQSALREEMKKGQDDLREEIGEVKEGVDNNGKRLDKIGSQLAYLEDDTPTREEYDGLEDRVTTIEEKLQI